MSHRKMGLDWNKGLGFTGFRALQLVHGWDSMKKCKVLFLIGFKYT